MILILGGTTEGRLSVQELEEAGRPFYYSTRRDEQEITLHHGIRLTGGMDADEMVAFCREKQIGLLVDAAHPFAEQLHQTVETAARQLQLPVIRFERIYPEQDDDRLITWCNGYADAIEKIGQAGIEVLLALTGVQTIEKLKPLWQSPMQCYFRILDRDSSRLIASRAGFPASHLCYYKSESDDPQLIEQLAPQAILTKESGVSGGFNEKVEMAHRAGLQLFVIRRPSMPHSFIVVNGPHGLRRQVERLLPDFYPLKSGLTTGTCATAAATAALYNLLGQQPAELPILLPSGETIPVGVVQREAGSGQAYVIKESGDDPDITNGTPIEAKVQFIRAEEAFSIEICGGEGVGTVTLPGIGLPVGGPAINVSPRKMIRENVTRALKTLQAPQGKYRVTISVPQGKELAERTFNPRLGIMGGISIIGTSGIIKPFSTDAFVRSIRKTMEVACATKSPFIVINSGAKSERFLHKRFPQLPTQAFVHYGNFIGETLKIAHELKVSRLVMGLMIGKAVKLAEGHMDTHSKLTTMNKPFLQEMAMAAGCSEASQEAISHITLARELWQLLRPDELPRFTNEIIRRCHQCCLPLFPEGHLSIVLITEEGEIIESE